MLTGDAVATFWRTTDAEEWFAETPADGVLMRPDDRAADRRSRGVHVALLRDRQDRHGLDNAANWPVPFWLTDTAMAVQNLLLLIEARRLGALYFGIFRNADVLFADLGVPEGMLSVGARRDRAIVQPTDRPSGSADDSSAAVDAPRSSTTTIGSYRRANGIADPAGRLPGARRPRRTSSPTSARRCGARYFDRRNACANCGGTEFGAGRRRHRRRGPLVHDRHVRRARRAGAVRVGDRRLRRHQRARQPHQRRTRPRARHARA